MQRVAIFGGTFDPVHWGHLLIAEMALNQAGLDQVLWVPTHHPPYKAQQSLSSFTHRLEMIRRAIAEYPTFALSDLEANRTEASYAIDTFTELSQVHPNTDWYWLIGLDAFQSLPKWRGSTQLVAQCGWLVAPRNCEGQVNSQLEQQVAALIALQTVQLRWQLLHMPQIAVSSSLVRQYCKAGRSVKYLVPDAVRTYILEQRLYSREADRSVKN